MADLGAELDHIAHDIRLIINNLAFIDFDNSNFPDILDHMMSSFKESSDATYTLELSTPLIFHDPMVAIQLLRITQEAVNNAIKHSNATQINVSFIKADSYTKLSIIDNGCGLKARSDVSTAPSGRSGCGLDNMRYRAHVIGGNFETRSSDTEGTHIYCTIFP